MLGGDVVNQIHEAHALTVQVMLITRLSLLFVIACPMHIATSVCQLHPSIR